jgi:hypothetical protein
MATKAATEAVKTQTRTQLRLIALPLCKKPDLIYYYAHKRQIKGKQPEGAAESKASDVEPVNVPEKGQLATYLSKATSQCDFMWNSSPGAQLRCIVLQTRQLSNGRS